jgi:hypothetical protein
MKSTDVFFHIDDGVVVSIIENGMIKVGDICPSADILDLWTADDLAEYGIVRAPRIEPMVNWSTEVPDGYKPCQQADGAWVYMLQLRNKTAEELADAHTQARAAITQQRDALLAPVLAKLDRHRNQRDYGIPTTLTDGQAQECARYAQDLRDLLDTVTDPATVAWPLNPLA